MRFRVLAAGLFVCLAGFGNDASVDALMEAGHWKRLRALAAARLAANPNDAQARGWMAKAKIAFGDYESAAAEAERAVGSEPNNATYQSLLAEACAMVADSSGVVKGLVYVRRMRRAIEASLAVDSKHIDTMLVEMMFSFKAPGMAGGDKKKAWRVAEQIQSVSQAWGYLAQARLLQTSGEDQRTENLLTGAVKADPSFYRAQVALARFYCCTARNRRPALAERSAMEALALDPAAAPAYEILARVHASAQHWAELEDILARSERAVPDDLTPHYGAAQALIESGQDFRRAERYLNQYLGQAVEGREPTHAQARWLLASLFEKEGRKSDAVRELMAAVRLQPDFEQAKRDLKRLRAA